MRPRSSNGRMVGIEPGKAWKNKTVYNVNYNKSFKWKIKQNDIFIQN